MPDEISVDDLTTVLLATVRGEALNAAGPYIVEDLYRAIAAYHQIEYALQHANDTHVDGEFTPDDRAVVESAKNYIKAETEFMRKLLKYVESAQAGLLGLSAPVMPDFKGLLPG